MMINRRNIQEIQKSPIMCFTPKLHTTATLIALHEYKLSLYHLQPFYLFVYELLVVATISTFCYGGLQECCIIVASASSSFEIDSTRRLMPPAPIN